MKIVRLVIWLSGLGLVACSSVVVPGMAQVKVGVSTEADVIARFGKPDATIGRADGSRIDRYRLPGNRTSPWNYVPVVSLFAGVWPNVRLVEVTFTFNPQGILAATAQSSAPQG